MTVVNFIIGVVALIMPSLLVYWPSGGPEE